MRSECQKATKWSATGNASDNFTGKGTDVCTGSITGTCTGSAMCNRFFYKASWPVRGFPKPVSEKRAAGLSLEEESSPETTPRTDREQEQQTNFGRGHVACRENQSMMKATLSDSSSSKTVCCMLVEQVGGGVNEWPDRREPLRKCLRDHRKHNRSDIGSQPIKPAKSIQNQLAIDCLCKLRYATESRPCWNAWL